MGMIIRCVVLLPVAIIQVTLQDLVHITTMHRPEYAASIYFKLEYTTTVLCDWIFFESCRNGKLVTALNTTILLQKLTFCRNDFS